MKLEITYRKTSELIPYARNSRTHSDEQVMQVASSIKEFGFTNPILLDGNNGIIAGHGRLEAAKKLGMDEVPTVDLSHFTEAQKKAYIIADNQLALNAGWDEELLKIEIEELDEMDFNLDLLGFDDEFMEGLNGDKENFEDKNKELDLDDFDDQMEMRFSFSKEQYDFVSERLSHINSSKESALMEVLDES